MAVHSEIKVSYQILEYIVQNLKKYETALQTMQTSIANMDRIIAENEGKTFTELAKVKHDFDDEIVTCKEEVKDLYSNIANYVSDMKSIISARPAGALMTVDRIDIYWNKESIRGACNEIARIGRANPGYTIDTDNYEAGSNELNKIQSDVQRVAKMKAAIAATATKMSSYCDQIDKIYKNKIVKFEDRDDEHERKIFRLHTKYTNLPEYFREIEEIKLDVKKGIVGWLKDTVLGLVKLATLPARVKIYVFCKIFKIEPPKWSKDAFETLKALKNIRLDIVIESLCQGASDTLAEKGYAYGAGYVAAEVAFTIATYGAGKVASKADDAARIAKAANKADDIADTARNLDRIDDIGDAARGAEKIDDIGDAARGSKATEKTFKSSYDIPVDENGYTKSSLELGRKVHEEYKAGEVYGKIREKEARLPSGKRVDFIDLENKIIYELKPNNPKQIAKGKKQLAEYVKEAEREFGGEWTGVLDTY